jgi:hypothetical protein
MKTKVHALIVSALLLAPFAASANSASALACENPEMLVSSTRGRMISISGSEISRTAMSNLWAIVTQDTEISTTMIGKMIGEDQNWLGSCFFPGVGLGVGSGYDADTRNVAVWVWANEVDLVKARRSILTRIELPVTTTSLAPVTTTSTTIELPTTTTTLPAETTTTTTIADVQEETTTTSSVPATTTTTAVEAEPAAVATSAAFAAVAPSGVVKFSVQQSLAGKKRCKTSVVKVKNKKTKKLVKVRKVVCK